MLAASPTTPPKLTRRLSDLATLTDKYNNNTRLSSVLLASNIDLPFHTSILTTTSTFAPSSFFGSSIDNYQHHLNPVQSSQQNNCSNLPFDPYSFAPQHQYQNHQNQQQRTGINSNMTFAHDHSNYSPPESLFSVMADLESTGTTETASPGTEQGDFFFKTAPPIDQQPPPFLYHNQKKNLEQHFSYATNNTVLAAAANASTSSSNPYLLTTGQQQHHSMDDMNGSEVMTRIKLREAYEIIATLSRELNITKLELDKKKSQVTNIQSNLENKDLECIGKDEKIKKLAVEINSYQSLLHSKGLLEFSGDNYNRNHKLTLPSNCNANDNSNGSNNSTGNNNNKLNHATTTAAAAVLDQSVDWDSLVDRIVKETDQRASIFLQNKLKTGTPEQKHLIFIAVLRQSYDLMTNRFGNFLVQRLLELGTTEQIEALASTMEGHILQLTCEPFGCHVVQKSFDYVIESTRAGMISELFHRIPETITHKYACHVWQKVFEARWIDETVTPPPIMMRLHETLKGQWVQVALDETGSLVVQNIFENLGESDKKPILEEVLANAVQVAKGQWGNWVLQHILEQSEDKQDRKRAFQCIIDASVQLSTDQYASKVVEKALRIGGQHFINAFVEKISSTTDYPNNSFKRNRIPMIDIASDQYGNYVIQWIINNLNPLPQKIAICRSIKKHMVSLRGTKYGQRVAFLVETVLRTASSDQLPSTY